MFYQVVECKMTIATARGIEKYLLIHTNLKTSWWDCLFIHWISKYAYMGYEIMRNHK